MIPARLASTRLPGKLLLDRTGKPLILHTIDRALESEETDKIVVLTPDREIASVVEKLGHEKVWVVPSDPSHPNGTARIAEFAKGYEDRTIFVNLQGDEPELPGCHIDRLVEILKRRTDVRSVVTMATPIAADEAATNNVVKVVTDHYSNALWFSRLPIPVGGPHLRHVGIYAYRGAFLKAHRWPPLYQGEGLEQLQWLENMTPIKVYKATVDSVGVDTQADYDRFVERYAAGQRGQ